MPSVDPRLHAPLRLGLNRIVSRGVKSICCMLHYISMARGESGRIVVEVDCDQKRELYAALAESGSALKDCFIHASAQYFRRVRQPELFGDAEVPGRDSISVVTTKASRV